MLCSYAEDVVYVHRGFKFLSRESRVEAARF